MCALQGVAVRGLGCGGNVLCYGERGGCQWFCLCLFLSDIYPQAQWSYELEAQGVGGKRKFLSSPEIGGETIGHFVPIVTDT